VRGRYRDSRCFNSDYFTESYSRKALGGSTDNFDVAGNVTHTTTYSGGASDNKSWEFDAAGRSWRWTEAGPWGLLEQQGGETVFDGDGRAAKQSSLDNTYDIHLPGWTGWRATPTYNLYSSVTGEKITELNDQGAYYRTHIYMGHTEIAWRDTEIMWHLTDPSAAAPVK